MLFIREIEKDTANIYEPSSCYENPMTMTVCGAQYQMPAIFAFSPSSMWAITVRIAITGDEFDNAANNSTILSSIQAVHPTVFHWFCFSNSLNRAIVQFLPWKQTLLWLTLPLIDTVDDVKDFIVSKLKTAFLKTKKQTKKLCSKQIYYKKKIDINLNFARLGCGSFSSLNFLRWHK